MERERRGGTEGEGKHKVLVCVPWGWQSELLRLGFLLSTRDLTTSLHCSKVSGSSEPLAQRPVCTAPGAPKRLAGHNCPAVTYAFIQLDLHLLLGDALLDPLAKAGVACRPAAPLTVLPQAAQLPGTRSSCSWGSSRRDCPGAGDLSSSSRPGPVPRRSGGGGGGGGSDHGSHCSGRIPTAAHLLWREAVHDYKIGGAGEDRNLASPLSGDSRVSAGSLKHLPWSQQFTLHPKFYGGKAKHQAFPASWRLLAPGQWTVLAVGIQSPPAPGAGTQLSVTWIGFCSWTAASPPPSRPSTCASATRLLSSRPFHSAARHNGNCSTLLGSQHELGSDLAPSRVEGTTYPSKPRGNGPVSSLPLLKLGGPQGRVVGFALFSYF